ncbi:unnamed protein product [Linum tenue]|uniref:Micro-fibrillar-associated protein 1 C-terminal domain-containing protein n=1 Tax=Linum tenue TaxID=586396 RepID=A0AAV0LH35_9ROSI|nr:unnamed protein product [Linum tenue]
MREREEAVLLPVEEEEDDEEAEQEESSEYEADSKEETTCMKMVKPVFVPKSESYIIVERERLAEEERAFEEKVRKKIEERKVDTKHMLVEEIKKEDQIQKNLEMEAEIVDVDTDDEMNKAEEYETWKVREIGRIKRDREDREEMLKEKEEFERGRNMTEEERREWERKNPKPAPPPKQKWTLMHNIITKVPSFKMNLLRVVGQIRISLVGISLHQLVKIGWIILFCLKLCRLDSGLWLNREIINIHFWYLSRWTYNDPLHAKYNAKMAGMNAPIAKPKGSRKLKDWETK